MGIVFAAMTAGETSAMGADIGEGTLAAHKIVDLLNKEVNLAIIAVNNYIFLQTKIDNMGEGGKVPSSCEGNVKFSDVKFAYPTRPDCQVLKGLTLDIKTGPTTHCKPISF